MLPGAVEVDWPRQRSIGWGTGPKKFTEQFAYLMPFTRHVTLGFYRGGELPDPDGLLPAAGGSQVDGTLSMRSLKIARRDDVRRPAVRALVDAAVRHQMAQLDGPGQHRGQAAVRSFAARSCLRRVRRPRRRWVARWFP